MKWNRNQRNTAISYHTLHFALSVSGMYKTVASTIQELKNLVVCKTDKLLDECS